MIFILSCIHIILLNEISKEPSFLIDVILSALKEAPMRLSDEPDPGNVLGCCIVFC